MKHTVRRFKSHKIGLKELEPFIHDGQHLQTGKPFSRFGDLRSREILANWRVCAVVSHVQPGDFYFTTDPTGGGRRILRRRLGRHVADRACDGA
jgi:hypothetical protein